MHTVCLDPPFDISIGNGLPFVAIAGPCVLEDLDSGLRAAEFLKKIFYKLNIPFIYKSSFDKANRSSSLSYRGVGFDKGLDIFLKIKNALDIPILSDVHELWQIKELAEVIDVLQTPAFLCRQTDFIQNVAATQKPLNVKKGQFLAPQDMKNVIDKIIETGNKRILLCERGTMFGYNDIIADMRSLAIMSKMLFPIVFDATHSVQLPNQLGNASGGQREFVHVLATAAISTGIAAIFVETHPNPDDALCDGPCMIPLSEVEGLFSRIKSIDNLIKSHPAT